MKRLALAAIIAAVAVSGCGKSEEQKQQEQAAKTAEQAASQAAKGLEDMAKSLEAMAGGGTSGEKPVEPVSFRDMAALMPEVEGWEREKPTGEKMTTPFPISMAEASYTKGESRIEVKMTDSGFNQLLLVPYSMFLTSGYEKETAEGYEKSANVNGQPGWETWNGETKYGEVNALVGKRFLVQIEGNGIEDNKVLHDIARKIDMGKLAALK